MGVSVHRRLREYVVERGSAKQLVGSIFKGKVNNVVRGLQAAFVDLGLEQNAFLYLREQEQLSEGESVLVQVTKDARGSKGPSVTRELTLPGRYLVLMPFSDMVGLSKKLTDKDNRTRLRNLVEEARPDNMGFVVRTAAAEASDEQILDDMRMLAASWRVVWARAQHSRHPQLLYRELSLPVRIVRDYVKAEVERIIIDDESVCQRVRELLDMASNHKVSVEYYADSEDIFSKLGFTEQIDGISDRKVWLECGGYLVFDYTEAMTVIDVNSGKYSGSGTLEGTVMEINRQAAQEIALQLQLRDIGGIIIIDFIDMHTPEDRQELLALLRRAFADDAMKPKVQGITNLNLVEVTRRKARQNLSSVLYDTCPTCKGSGYVESAETVGIEIRRRLRSFIRQGLSSKELILTVHPAVAGWLAKSELKAMEAEFSCRIKVVGDNRLHVEAFSILDDVK